MVQLKIAMYCFSDKITCYTSSLLVSGFIMFMWSYLLQVFVLYMC